MQVACAVTEGLFERCLGTKDRDVKVPAGGEVMSGTAFLQGGRGTCLKALAVLLLVAAMGLPQFAVAQPRCDDFRKAYAGNPANRSDPRVAQAVAIWEQVRGKVRLLTGLDADLAIVGPEARQSDGSGFPPYALCCPGAPATVFVTYPLLEKIHCPDCGESGAVTESRASTPAEASKAGDPPSCSGTDLPRAFLAFVFAHELSHRVNDLKVSGREAKSLADVTAHGDLADPLADLRAAFFTNAAGYSTRGLQDGKTIDCFLASVEGYPGTHRTTRQTYLKKALENFDRYEELYQVGIAMAMAGETEAGRRLLDWADQQMRVNEAAVPEVMVGRALVTMMDVAPRSPWVRALPPGAEGLRCTPVYPGHTALWEHASDSLRLLGAGAADDEVVKELGEVIDLLDQAARLGASPLSVASGKACAYLYLGKVEEANASLKAAEAALKDLEQAGTRAPKRSFGPLRKALTGNRELVKVAGFLNKHPYSARREAKSAAAWRAEAKRVKTRLPRLSDAMTAAISGKPMRPNRMPDSPPPDPTRLQGFVVPGFDRMPSDLGACPDGWVVEYSLPSAVDAKDSGSNSGVTVCVPSQKSTAGKVRLVHVSLPGASSPEYRDFDKTLVMVDAPAAPANALENWRRGCPNTIQTGVSDLGEEGFMVSNCREAGVPFGAVFADERGRVSRVVVVR